MLKKIKTYLGLRKILSTALVLLWMITVFIFSSQDGKQTLNTSGAFIHAIETNITDNNSQVSSNNNKQADKEDTNEDYKYVYSDKIQKIVRKNAHYFLYMVGGVVLSVFFCLNFSKNTMIYSLITGILYAITDEFHQLFVPGRTSSYKDVLIDSFGIISGIVLFLILKYIFNKRKRWGKENVTVKSSK